MVDVTSDGAPSPPEKPLGHKPTGTAKALMVTIAIALDLG